jgi:hypothetical protein
VRLGITCLVAPEHLQADPYRMLRPWPTLAALRAEIIPFEAVGSVIAGLSSVPQLLGDLATVTDIGSAPTGVALEAGYRADEFAAAGRAFEERFRSRAHVRRALADTGEVPRSLLWSAAGSIEAARRAERDGARWYCAPTTSDRTAAQISAALGAGGVLRRDVLIGASTTDLRQRWQQYVAPKYGAYAAWGYTRGADQVLAGSAEQVRNQLGSLIATAHPSGIVLRLCWPDMDGSCALDHVHTVGQEVLPVLSHITVSSSAGSP